MTSSQRIHWKVTCVKRRNFKSFIAHLTIRQGHPFPVKATIQSRWDSPAQNNLQCVQNKGAEKVQWRFNWPLLFWLSLAIVRRNVTQYFDSKWRISNVCPWNRKNSRRTEKQSTLVYLFKLLYVLIHIFRAIKFLLNFSCKKVFM